MDEERYRSAERALWDHWGLRPQERWVQLPSTGTRVRVLDVGHGPPVLFVHGAAVGASCWADLASRLPQHRCLMLDRPGCALSEPLPAPPGVDGLPRLADRLLVEVLDGLDVHSADLVSNSLGGYFALRTAAAHPDRVGAVLHVGWTVGAPLDELPLVMRLAADRRLAPVAARLPSPRPAVVAMLRATGLARAIDDGRMPAVGIDWNHALQNATDTRVHEYRIAGGASLRRQIEALRLPHDLLERITAPVRVLFGTEDPFGSVEAMQRTVDALPAGELEVWPDAGHAVWIDDLDRASAVALEVLGRPGRR